MISNSSEKGGLQGIWARFDSKIMKPFFIDDWPDVKRDHLEITNKIVDLFNFHQQKKIRNKEMSDIMNQFNEKDKY